jgi:preprotein translocase subunit SecG
MINTRKTITLGTILKIVAILAVFLIIAICLIPGIGLGAWVAVNGVAFLGWAGSGLLNAFLNLTFWFGVAIVAIPMTLYMTRSYWRKQKTLVISPLTGAGSQPYMSNIPSQVISSPIQQQPIQQQEVTNA